LNVVRDIVALLVVLVALVLYGRKRVRWLIGC